MSGGEQEEQVSRPAVSKKRSPRQQRGIADDPAAADEATTNAPHLLRAPEVPFEVAIPTLGRWRPAYLVNPHERNLKSVTRPFILEKSLAFLGRHGVPLERVTLFVASADEAMNYATALKGSSWDGTRIVVGVRGILEQRNFIVRYFPAGAYIVSVDDDVSNIFWKSGPGRSSRLLRPLPCGALLPLIFDAHQRMLTYKAFICGLNSTASKNLLNMHVDGISTRNGEINGFLYFFINRHSEELLPCVADATEDAERSLRYFKKDNRVLRYRMYCGDTRCFQNRGGLQSLYGEWGETLATVNERRKTVERQAAQRLHQMFPELTGKPKEKKAVKTLEIHFIAKGGCPIPSTTLAEFEKNYQAERASQPWNNRASARRSVQGKEVPPAAQRASQPRKSRGSRRRSTQGKEVPPAAAEGVRKHSEAAAEEKAAEEAIVTTRSPKPAVAAAQTWEEAAALEFGEWNLPPGVDAVEVLSTSSSSLSSTEEDFDDWWGMQEEARLLGTQDEALVVLSSDSEPDEARLVDEDHHLLEQMRRSRAAQGGETSKSNQDGLVQAILRSINGDVADPVAAALEASAAVSELEAKREEEEAEQLQKALATSTAKADEDARQLAEVLGLSREVCTEALLANGWSLDAAAAALLERGPPQQEASDETAGSASPLREQPTPDEQMGGAFPRGDALPSDEPSVPSPSKKRPRLDDHG